MRKRQFLGTLMGAGGAVLAGGRGDGAAAAGRLKVTRVRFYEAPEPRPTFNQSNAVVTVETDQGITGVGEGGSREIASTCPTRSG